MIEICGHAIVSADDKIADATGLMPAGLRHEADWQQFQHQLDQASLIVLGRIGHAMFPNPKGRRRLILSHQAQGLELRADGFWWNPQLMNWREVAAKLLAEGGRVAVTGGRLVFDEFLAIGFDCFYLARAENVTISDGVPIFSQCRNGISAQDVLRQHGLAQRNYAMLDDKARVSLSIWQAGAKQG